MSENKKAKESEGKGSVIKKFKNMLLAIRKTKKDE